MKNIKNSIVLITSFIICIWLGYNISDKTKELVKQNTKSSGSNIISDSLETKMILDKLSNLENMITNVKEKQTVFEDNVDELYHIVANNNSVDKEARQKKEEKSKNKEFNKEPKKATQAEAMQREQKRSDSLQEILGYENIDTSWSSETEELALISIKSDKMGQGTIDAIECRSTMCRAVVMHDDMDAQNKFMYAMVSQPPWNTNGWIRPINDLEMEVFFTREGVNLPE